MSSAPLATTSHASVVPAARPTRAGRTVELAPWDRPAAAWERGLERFAVGATRPRTFGGAAAAMVLALVASSIGLG